MEFSPKQRPSDIESHELYLEQDREPKRRVSEQRAHEEINQLLTELPEPTSLDFGGRSYPIESKEELGIARSQARVVAIENFKEGLKKGLSAVSDDEERFCMEVYAARRLSLEKAKLQLLYAQHDLNKLNPKLAEEILRGGETGTPTDLDKKYTVH
jgi:hypothetical protein